MYELPHWPAKEAGTESDPTASCAPPSLFLLPLSYSGAGGKVEFVSFLGVQMSYISNLCKKQHRCTNIELHLQSELSFLLERVFHLTVSVVIWDERVHWEGELLQKAQSYSFGSTAI